MIGGDPTIAGWTICLGAISAGGLCASAAWTMRTARHRAAFWLISAGLLLLIGINKQLDLQTMMINIGRSIAVRQGWWDQRAWAQRTALAAAIVAAMLVGMWMIRTAWRHGMGERLCVVSIAILTCYVLLRMTAIVRQDDILPELLHADRLAMACELTGLAGAGISAWLARHSFAKDSVHAVD